MKERLRSFRKYFDSYKPLKKFHKDVFEAIVEKIILGGINEKGQKDPYQITFIFKTGPKPTINVGEGKKNGTMKSLIKKGEELCSTLSVHHVETVCFLKSLRGYRSLHMALYMSMET